MIELSEVKSDDDLDILTPLLWYSYSHPAIPFLPLLFPAPDDSPEGKDRAIQTSRQLFRKMHQADPSSHWLKVTDTETGEVIGGCRWHLHRADPYVSVRGKKFIAPTYPDGAEKDFASLVLGQVLNPRAERYAKPHAHLHICFVHPDHRRKGIGALLVAWGVGKADEMGVEAFIEATPIGKHLYETFGFVVVTTEEANTQIEKPSKRWEELESKFLPYTWHCMWRPVGGIYVEGETKLPWEQPAAIQS
ncbi:putative GNAT family acetyltransferase [Zopfia rhizophila CBS 207.26]|uniref:Putative GNAT family acetyltransferase n=1 Tax=Zopfia rhizophila CBS 207.26 TaxID=1314779 RepID=A0A6A6E8Y7_9PEZI|nr:putative GNAT family acetyltransferase [Zopfia rhizophila CBS 207.26]